MTGRGRGRGRGFKPASATPMREPEPETVAKLVQESRGEAFDCPRTEGTRTDTGVEIL